MKWNIGCSGFSYIDWTEYFYPKELPPTSWLEYYAQHFDTVEINSTFYNMPGPAFLRNLHSKTPQDFCFVVKAPKLITHTNQFNNCEKLITEFYTVIKNGLNEKLGAVLFQLPASFNYTAQNLVLIINNLDSSFLNVIEFRHKSWWNETVYKKLAAKNISFCGVSYPGLPNEVIINTDSPYYRFHGVPKLYYSMYDNSFLKKRAQLLLENKNIEKGFFLFNNTATRAALENASYVQEYVSL